MLAAEPNTPFDGPLLPMAGGGNNRVFKGRLNGRDVLVKHYFQHGDDPRDRFRTERQFYDYISKRELGGVPQPLMWMENERWGVFEFIDGMRPQKASTDLITQALAFAQGLNDPRLQPGPSELQEASEACFTLSEHLSCVAKRVERLENIMAETSLHEDAIKIVTDRIGPVWDAAQKSFLSQLSGWDDFPLPQSARCASPSDFGFHNSLVRPDGSACFFDFEYAGQDDPAKMICDFFSQPEVPAPMEHLTSFIKAFEPMCEKLAVRVNCLLPLYRVKWLCILMNDFLPVDSARRQFARPGDASKRQEIQIKKIISLTS